MKPGDRWKSTGRFIICLVLLLWIFHAIFLQEGKREWMAAGHSWDELTRWQRWELAWTEGPSELWHTLRMVSPGAFGLSLIFMGGTIALGVVRWRLALQVQGLHLPMARVAEISLVAHFFNSFLLGSTGGDLLKAYYVARETHHKKAEAVVTVLVDRLLGLFAMLCFAMVMMVVNLGLLRQHARLEAIAWLIVLMWLAAGGATALAFWGALPERWPWIWRLFRRLPAGEFVQRAVDACRRFGGDSAFLTRVLSLSMCLNIVNVFQILALAAGLNLHVPVQAWFVIVPTIVCLAALPVTPSGLGVRENLYVLMLTVPEIGVDATRALAVSLLAYAGSLIWSMIGGVVYAFRKDRDHLPEVDEAGAMREAL